MNHLKLYSFFLCMFFFNYNSCHADKPDMIFSFTPMSMQTNESMLLQNFMSHAKYTAIPLVAYFFHTISNRNIITDITNHPCASAVILYTTCYCTYYQIQNYKKAAIESEMQNILQQIFNLIVIGYGVHNLMIQKIELETKATNSIDNHLEKLDLFLQNAYNTWIHLFLECMKQNNHKYIFKYKIEQLNIFEILQASSHDSDLMNCIIYDYPYNHKTILEELEKKLHFYHQKLIALQLS